MSKKIYGYFLYKGQDHSDIFLEHIASGRSFKLTKKSFEYSDNLKEIDTILFIGLVKWKDEWWFSGVHFQRSFDADLILDEKNSVESRKTVDFLDHQKKEVIEFLERQNEIFKDFNAGSQIAFMPSEKVEEFVKAYTDHYNKSLKLTEKEIKKSQKRMRKDGLFMTDRNLMDFSGKERPESALVFFNPKSGCEIAFDVNSAFPLPNNPYFEESLSEDHIGRLLMNESISTELAMFCVDNCSSELHYFKERPGKWFLTDMDFLLRFWKKDNYHTKPAVTLTGHDKK